MPFDASNRKQIRQAEKLLAIRERDRVNFLCAAMTTEAGRAYFHDQLSKGHIFSTTFTGDALTSAHLEGERNFALRIYNDIVTHSPDSFVIMMKEATIKDLTNDRRARDSSDTSPEPTPDGEHGGSQDTLWGDIGSDPATTEPADAR